MPPESTPPESSPSESDISIRHAIGVMTGTSIDGLDAALVRMEGRGYDLRAELLRRETTLLGQLTVPLRAAANQQPMTTGAFAKLAWDFGCLHEQAIASLAGRVAKLDVIAVHGQTVFHAPPVSWQLINPAPIEQAFDCPVVCDLRQADLAQGGQGAPITPLADWIMFRDESRARAIVNLGGFINITLLPPTHKQAASPLTAIPPDLKKIHGFDLCTCNQLLDAIARQAFGYAYDEGGRRAKSGIAREELVTSLVERLRGQGTLKRSLGTGDELEQWVQGNLHDAPPADLAASACTALSRCLNESIERFGAKHYTIDEIILAGGGTKNLALTDAITRTASQRVQLSDTCGVPTDAREAMAMAILGALKLDGFPITLPQVTGRSMPFKAPASSSPLHTR